VASAEQLSELEARLKRDPMWVAVAAQADRKQAGQRRSCLRHHAKSGLRQASQLDICPSLKVKDQSHRRLGGMGHGISVQAAKSEVGRTVN
jgi:hypothetical protein